ncbi:MAG: hypothetical protein GXP61_09900 [Epsilonproteobacteria bacterium]|nr:hypothetical protein [Campylobacterota bacterium]
MLSKIVLVIVTVLFLAISLFYFMGNSSYQNSFEARFYYLVGNYDKAYEFAQKAYKEDSYNKMAFTVLTQSKIAKKYVDYIKEGNKYFDRIDKISSEKNYKEADKIRIKLMCQIMIGEYQKLVPTELTDKELVEDAKKTYTKFKQLYEQLF